MIGFHDAFKKQSLKLKIAILSTIVATTAMFIVSVCFILFETGRFKRDLQNEQLVRLNLVGNNIAAALVFDDNATIKDSLNIFKTLPDVNTVVVYSAEGVPINRYIQKSYTPKHVSDTNLAELKTFPLETSASVGYIYRDNLLISQKPIFIDNEIVGVIASETRLDALTRTVVNYLIIAIAIIPIVICLAYTLGRFFSQRLTQPIDDLAQTMADVKQTNNYDLRAARGFDNEMGNLAENFNEMLMEIRLRDQRLESQTSELLREKDKAEAASRAKSEFLANMSHELRTPMNGILGMTEVLMRSGLPEEQQKFAEIIYRSGSALTTILNDILDFSKIEADKLDLDIAPFEIKTMATDVINLLDNKAREKDIELRVKFNDNLRKMARGDAGRIRQVLTNIVGNAIKFTNRGGVTVDIRGKTIGKYYKLSVSVKDTGIGIPSNKLDMVFQKFTQAESSTTRDYGGTGLGLAISRSLVEMMGGKIGVRSQEGEGSTFWFDIMLEQYGEGENALSPTYSNDVQMVIISHNEKNRTALANKFSAIGVNVSTHEKGTAALKYLQQNMGKNSQNPLIVVEDNKSGVDALSLLDRFRSSPFATGAKFIVLRSDTNENKTERFARNMNVQTINAPITLKALMNAVLDNITEQQVSLLKGLPANLINNKTDQKTDAPSASEAAQKASEQFVSTLSTEKSPVTHSEPSPPRSYAPIEAVVDAAPPQQQQQPQPQQPAPNTAQETIKTAEKRGKPRILIAEDNQINRMVLENMIDKEQFDVTFKFDGKAAVESHCKDPYDLILMDISMPVMNGKQATLAIRALEKRDLKPAVPIIAVTAHAMATHRDSYFEAGMSDYLAKPISQEELILMLHKWLPQTPDIMDKTEQRRRSA